jgi:hypothetical protein
MNQAHKRDLILKRLYQQHKAANTSSANLKELMEALHIYSKPGEEKKFVSLLGPYVSIHELKEGIPISLTDTGMAYVETHLLKG